MGGQVVLEVRRGVAQRYAMLLEQAVHLEPRLQSKQTPNLTFGQRASAIGFDGKRF